MDDSEIEALESQYMKAVYPSPNVPGANIVSFDSNLIEIGVRKLLDEVKTTRLQNELMRDVVDAARAMIGKNVERPEVYEAAGDAPKYWLALALRTWLKKRPQPAGNPWAPNKDYPEKPIEKRNDRCPKCNERTESRPHWCPVPG